MGDKIYYFLEIIFYIYLGYYLIVKPQKILRFFKKEKSKLLCMCVRFFGAIAAIINIAVNFAKLIS